MKTKLLKFTLLIIFTSIFMNLNAYAYQVDIAKKYSTPKSKNFINGVLDILSKDTGLRDKLEENTMYFRNNLTKLGFDINEGVHPIVPVMLYDAKLAQEMSNCLMQKVFML